MAGIVYYKCGHSIWDASFPQDSDWLSEVECPDCAVVKFVAGEDTDEPTVV